MKKNFSLAILFFSFFCTHLKAQLSNQLQLAQICIPYYMRSHDVSKGDYALSADFKNNGSSVIGGYTNSNTHGDYDALITAFDSKGNIAWSKKFGGLGNDYINKLRFTVDGGFIAVGSTSSYSSGATAVAWIIKFNSTGSIMWARTFDDGNLYGSTASNVVETTDGGYAICGTYANTAGIADAMVIKTDSLGNVKWSKRFNSFSTDISRGLIQSGDALVISAFEVGQSSSYADGIIMKLAMKTGTVLWSRRLDIDSRNNNFHEIFKHGRGFVLHSLDINDYYGGDAATTILNLTSDGSPQKVTKVSFNNPYDLAHGPGTPTSDGGNINIQFGLGVQNDLYLLKTSGGGDLQWIRKISGIGRRSGNAIKQLPDGGYAIAGFSNNANTGTADSTNIFMMRTDAEGNIPGCGYSTEGGYAQTPLYYYDPAFVWTEIADITFPPSSLVVTLNDLTFKSKKVCYSCVPASTTVRQTLSNNALLPVTTGDFAIYPNPVKDVISVSVKGSSMTNALIIVNDIYGRVMMQQKMQSSQQSFSVAHLPAGVYTARLVTDDGKKIKGKFVKQ